MVDNNELFRKCMKVSRELRLNGEQAGAHRPGHGHGHGPHGPRFEGQMPGRPMPPFKSAGPHRPPFEGAAPVGRPMPPRGGGQMPGRPMPPRGWYTPKRPAPFCRGCVMQGSMPPFAGGMAPYGRPTPPFGGGMAPYGRPMPPFKGGMPGNAPFGGAPHGKGPGRGHGMFRSRERLLVFIGDHPEGVWQKDLAADAGINASSASEVLARLEADGYIVRTPDENDKRAVRLTLTDAGKERADAIRAERSSVLENAFSKLTEEEKQTLSDLLDKLLS